MVGRWGSSSSGSSLDTYGGGTPVDTVRALLRRYERQRAQVALGARFNEGSTLAPVLRNRHVTTRVLSYLGGREVLQAAGVCRGLYSHTFSKLLWRLVYLSEAPLKYSDTAHSLCQLLLLPLLDTAFDVETLETRGQHFALFVALSTCGYHRVVSSVPTTREWPAGVVTNADEALAYLVGRELARRDRGGACGFPQTPLSSQPSARAVVAAVFGPRATLRETSSSALAVTFPWHAQARTAVLTEDLWVAVVTGAAVEFGFPHSTAWVVTATGAATVEIEWVHIEACPMTSAAYTLAPNAMYWSKTPRLLDAAIAEGVAGAGDMKAWVAEERPRGRGGRTPQERTVVECKTCGRHVTSLAYGAQHANGRCAQVSPGEMSLRSVPARSPSMASHTTHGSVESPQLPLHAVSSPAHSRGTPLTPQPSNASMSSLFRFGPARSPTPSLNQPPLSCRQRSPSPVDSLSSISSAYPAGRRSASLRRRRAPSAELESASQVLAFVTETLTNTENHTKPAAAGEAPPPAAPVTPPTNGTMSPTLQESPATLTLSESEFGSPAPLASRRGGAAFTYEPRTATPGPHPKSPVLSVDVRAADDDDDTVELSPESSYTASPRERRRSLMPGVFRRAWMQDPHVPQLDAYLDPAEATPSSASPSASMSTHYRSGSSRGSIMSMQWASPHSQLSSAATPHAVRKQLELQLSSNADGAYP